MLQRHLVRACEKARNQGVEVYGWGINTYGPQRYYGKENFIFLDKSEGMSKIFFRNLAKIILG